MANRRPLVTVVMPAYNQEQFIEGAVQSVLNQNFRDFELIVIDDGSTDSTSHIVQNMSDDPRIRLTSQENQGVSMARNQGIGLAEGHYIAFLDADDFWSSSWLSSAVSELKHNRIHGVVGPWQYVDEEGRPLPEKPMIISSSDLKLSSLILSNPISTSGIVIRRDCLESLGGFAPDLAVGEDKDLWLRLLREDFVLKALDQPLTYRRVHTTNTTLDLDLSRRHLLKVVERFFGKENGLSQNTQGLAAQARSRVYLHTCRLGLRLGKIDAAIRDFSNALRCDESRVFDLSTWFSLVCAEQPPGYRGTSAYLNLERAESNVIKLLENGRISELRLNEITAIAYVALARVAYAYKRDFAATRQYLLQAARNDVSTAMHYESVAYLIRAILGPQLVSLMREVKKEVL